MRRTAWWGWLSSVAAPVLLIGGWTLAAAAQPGFDSVAQTVSALSARGAQDRWVMTAALSGLGVCHLITSVALRPAATPGRVVLGIGGVATVLVAVFPLPADDSGSAAHTVAAAVAFTSLAVWPAAAGQRRRPLPWGLRAGVCAAATVLLLTGLGWFVAELVAHGSHVGLAERVAAGSQALWPLAVVATTRPGRRSRSDR